MDYPLKVRDEKDFAVKVRIEIGPGIPSQLQPIKEPDGRRALIKSLYEFLTSGNWPAGKVATGTEGAVTANAFHQSSRIGSVEPAGTLPLTFLEEHRFIVRLEEGTAAQPEAGE